MTTHSGPLRGEQTTFHQQRTLSRRGFVTAVAIAATAIMSSPPATAAYPGAGEDAFDSAVIVEIDLRFSGGPKMTVTGVGPTRIKRAAPRDPGDGRDVIDTEIVAMELRGVTPLGPAVMRLSGSERSLGEIKQQTAGEDFPADSFFDVFVEIDAPVVGVLHNEQPIHLMAVIDAIPPFQAEYIPEGTFPGVDLFNASGQKLGIIRHAAHFVGQKPSFSVAPAGPSGLNPAMIFDVSTSARIAPTWLGLTAGDNVNALSYGDDFIAYIMDLKFSVDPNSVGIPGSAVAREAAKWPMEAHGDEFRVVPMLPTGGSNAQVLDETGDTSPPFPLLIPDDVDALTEPPASFVDGDGDGIPERPVYFSLGPGSPSLAALPAGPGDILVSVGGSPPSVYIGASELGLRPEDDIDAFCLVDTSRTILYSLAPGSPSLGSGAGPSSLFRAVPPVPSPTVIHPYFYLGLRSVDNLNAMKCSLPEVDYFPHSEALITINGQTSKLTGPAKVHVGIDPSGKAREFGDNLDRVATEIVQLELHGDSIMGPITLRIGGNPSIGDIVENKNLTPGTLDVPPFAPGGTADSFFDVFFEVEMIGQILHNPEPTRWVATITHKPPAEDETYHSIGVVQLFNQSRQPVNVMIEEFSWTPNPARVEPPPNQPLFTAAGFLDAAGFALAPSTGGLATIFGEKLAKSLAQAIAIPLSTSLNNVTVEFFAGSPPQQAAKPGRREQAGGILAPLLFVSPAQINLQIPWEVDASSGSVNAVVTADGVASDPVEVPVTAAAPGIFTFDFGPGRAVAVNLDATVAQPDGSLAAQEITSRPVRIGEALIIYASGLGPTSPPAVTGDDSVDDGHFVRRATVTMPRVLIGGVEAQVLFSGMSPQFVGVYQVNVVVPGAVQPGDAVSLVIEIGGLQSRQDVTIAVAPAAGG